MNQPAVPSSLVALGLLLVSFILTWLWTPPLLRVLRALGMGRSIREDVPDRHKAKLGTVTMGGWVILLPVVLLFLFIHATRVYVFRFSGQLVLLPLTVLLAYGVLGAVDDWLGIHRGRGLRARTKFVIQVLIALGAMMWMYNLYEPPPFFLPGIPESLPVQAWWYVPLGVFIIVGSSNAVNLTDGLDGLASLVTSTSFIALGFLALFHQDLQVAQFAFLLAGSLLGFLWFNVHPAQVFMGDTGSLAVGAALGVVALMLGEWFVLPLLALIPVVETLSVILQVGYFKMTGGRRIFRMSPLHHHFELVGWAETQVVTRFWLVQVMAAIVGVAIAMA